MLHVIALLGVLSISFSAVFVRLAGVSPVTAAFFRAAYAVPVLILLWMTSDRKHRQSPRARALAGVSGAFLAIDLAFWHKSIALIGVGLATVIANVQVVFVGLGAWLLHGDKPTRGMVTIVGVVMAGLALTSGLSRPEAYGEAPALGTLLGVLAGLFYAAFLLIFRMANRSLGPTAGPLLDSTLGMLAGCLLVSPFDPGFALAPRFPAHGWLIALALGSQVAGWMFIATALPRLPAIETSILLLVQPVFALIWGVLFFSERLSSLQWAGSALVLGGIAIVARLANTRSANA